MRELIKTNTSNDGSNTYEMYLCENGQYEIESHGRCYKTETAEMLGHMPVLGGNTILYKDSDNGYFVISFSSDNQPSFSRLTETMGRLWAKGVEKYWAAKQV